MGAEKEKIIWAVRYGVRDGGASLVKTLADELDRLFDQFDEENRAWTSEDLAAALIDGLDMKPSGAGRKAA